VVQVTETPAPTPVERLPGSTPSARWAAAVTVVVIGIGLGALGTMLVTPGQSLAVPTAIVAAVGGGIMLVAWVVASFRAGRQAGWIFAVGAAVVTVLGCLWTFEFALPTSIEWSDATAQAQAIFIGLQRSPENFHGTVPPQPCVVHTTGSVGPLSAPYRECAVWTPVGHEVTFTANSPNSFRGLAYTDRPSVFFADECERHLVGKWWMFAPSTVSNGDPGSCYFGYQFHGGP
jgi:hypothetical protein